MPCRPVGTATGHEPARRGSQLLRLLPPRLRRRRGIYVWCLFLAACCFERAFDNDPAGGGASKCLLVLCCPRGHVGGGAHMRMAACVTVVACGGARAAADKASPDKQESAPRRRPRWRLRG